MTQRSMRPYRADGHRAAFSLIELLTVVAIIGVLLAILTASIGQSKKRSYVVKCTSNLRQLSVANTNYALKYKKYIDPDWGRHGPITIHDKTYKMGYWAIDRKFLTLVGLTDEEISNMFRPGANNAGMQWPDRFYCPQASKTVVAWSHRICYAGNATNSGNLKPSRVQAPAIKVAFTEARDYWFDKDGADYRKHWDVKGELDQYWHGNHGIKYRHDEGICFANYDGSAKWRPKEEMFFYQGNGVYGDNEKNERLYNQRNRPLAGSDE